MQKQVKCPIFFFNSATCPYCGEENVIESIDKFGRVAKKADIFPIYKMKCSHCNMEFFIRWVDIDDESHTARPVAISRAVIDDFVLEAKKEQQEQTKPLSYDRYEVIDYETF